MTDPSPDAVYVTFDAQVYTDPGWIDLPVENIVASVDIDRSPYCMATLTLGNITEDMWFYLDPRNIDPLVGDDHNIRLRMRVGGDGGSFLQWLGDTESADPDEYCRLHIRSATRNYLDGTTTVECGGREALLDDKKSIRTAPYDTAAPTVLDLVIYSLDEVFSGYVLSNDAVVGSTAIPAGDRRDHLPGESHNDLIEPELGAINCRLYDYWGDLWYVGSRDTPPHYDMGGLRADLSTFELPSIPGLTADPIVFSMTETLARDGDWADGVLVKFDTLAGGGTTDYQVDAGAGANTKGLMYTWDRAKPADNAADQIKSRAVIRGRDIDIEARTRFDVQPGQEIAVHLDDITTAGPSLPHMRVVIGIVRSVTWYAEQATMRITAQTGNPVD